MTATNRWDELHEQPRFCPVYPHEKVVAFTFRSFPRDRAGSFRILDVGCGAGRHAIFLASEGYRVVALDYSARGVDETARRAGAAGLTIETCVAEADTLPYADGSFDGVVCYGVLCYLPWERKAQAIRELHRVLVPGGKAFVMTRSTEDSRFRGAEPLGHRTFRLRDLGDGAPSSAESGMLMSAMTRDDAHELFGAFGEVVVNRSTIESAEGAFIDDDWHIHATRSPR
ncbi:MAG: class I SAM-dependent methyltransferase [Myxococcales bacterium]|nr:class I SAM-dependent methyltransferase [Myxococcales bacterium]